MDGFVCTDDQVKLRCTDEGTGRPVVFVHGFGCAAAQWASAAQALADTARVITYDRGARTLRRRSAGRDRHHHRSHHPRRHR